MALQLLGGEITVKDSELPDVPNGDPDVTYTIRQIDSVRNREISRRHTRRGRNGSESDHLAILDDMVDYALTAWSGVLVDGQPAACTRELKDLLDFPRKQAIVTLAATNRAVREDARAESFREPARVV